MADKKRRGLGVDALFPEQPTTPEPELAPAPERTAETLSRQDVETSKRYDGKTVKRQTVKETYYFDVETVDTLESTRPKIKRAVGSDRRKKVTKSIVVEAALLLALENLERLTDQVAKLLDAREESRQDDKPS